MAQVFQLNAEIDCLEVVSYRYPFFCETLPLPLPGAGSDCHVESLFQLSLSRSCGIVGGGSSSVGALVAANAVDADPPPLELGDIAPTQEKDEQETIEPL